MGLGVAYYQRTTRQPPELQPTNYERYLREPFNQPTYYPVSQPIASSRYRPIAAWTGRLILPPREQIQDREQVWLEVHHAPEPYQSLIGQWVNLTWSEDANVQAYVESVTQSVRFNDVAETSLLSGNLHPSRLNEVRRVGPLQSLAGARSANDVHVTLRGSVTVVENDASMGDRPTLAIHTDPVQITGRFYGLVTILEPVTASSDQPSPDQDQFRVRHYNSVSQQFDGAIEMIRIPQVPPSRQGVTMSTPQDIHRSPLNDDGWYVYGAANHQGVFVAQAIEPRRLLRLQPDDIILNQSDGLTYIQQQNWQHVAERTGTAASVLVDPQLTRPADALDSWQAGDRAIVMHLFGGIGGAQAEPKTLGVVTGHFSYGVAEVIRDSITGELRFQIDYYQVYAHNPEGIVAGVVSWADYMGNLQRGWLGTRPVSDVVIKLDAVTQDYDFDGIRLSPLSEFEHQLRIMTARYRVGDGTGAAVVTPATSCVQDSNQALYRTIKSIEFQIMSNPQIQDWLNRHPDDPQTIRFRQLTALAQALEQQLAPLGIVRRDWRQNSAFLEGTRSDQGWVKDSNILTALTSWRTLLPRRAHDEMSQILLNAGGSLWFLRTNQVGGVNPDITPIAPTTFLN